MEQLPVIAALSGVANESNTRSARSSGLPVRPSGIDEDQRCRRASGVSFSITRGVSVGPGATVFTRIPSGASSNANVLVKAMMPALAAEYGARKAEPVTP